jgi:hypothetical protein
LAQYALAKRILEMPEEKRAAWKQMQMVQNGVYPSEAPSVAVAMPPVDPFVGAVDASVNVGAVAAPPGVDPARAQAFAEYWAAFHAKKTAEQLGLEAPVLPPMPSAVQTPAPAPATSNAVCSEPLLAGTPSVCVSRLWLEQTQEGQ